MPVFKRGSKQDKKSYRLVQNSEAAAGILESLINSQVVKFLQENNLFPEQQFALPGKGTAQCLTDAYAHWIQNINDSKFSVVTSYDLQAAYGMVNLEILEKKLKALGFTQSAIAWFKSFLEVRNIETVINGVKSDKIERRRELAEGSPLSATLFLIATIDVNEYTKHSHQNGFMDDFVLTPSSQDLKLAIKMHNKMLKV